MCPSATRIGCKMKGRPQVTGMTGGCAGEWVSMFRCPYRASQTTWSKPYRPACSKPTRHRPGTECASTTEMASHHVTSFITDHEAHQKHIGCLADPSYHSDCHRRRPAAQRQMDTSGSAGRHRSHNQPLRWCHTPTLGSARPAGHRATTMWRSCSPDGHGVWLMTQSCLVCETSIGRGCNFCCYFTV